MDTNNFMQLVEGFKQISAKLEDPEFRALARKDAKAAAQILEYSDDLLNREDVTWIVKTNTKEKMYFSLPDSNILNDIGDITAAGPKPSSVSSVGTAGTGSTFSTACGTFGSILSSLGTVGTAGSAACS